MDSSKIIKDSARMGTLNKQRLYKIADSTWTVAAWLWTAVIIVFLVSFAAGLAVAPDPKNNFSNIVLHWLSTPQSGSLQEFLRITALLALILFVAVTLLSILFRQLFKDPPTTEMQELLTLVKKDMEESRKQEAAQRVKHEEGFSQYLHSMKNMNQNIGPEGLAQQSRTLVFSDVSLDDVFVPLHVIPDRPIFDIPAEQQRQLKQMQQRSDLSDREREDNIHRLRFTWHSQLRQEKAAAKQRISIDEVLRRFSPGNQMAIILGTPGSGKTTFLRWVAYHLASDLIAAGQSSQGLPPARLPILIKINDYAQRLAKEPTALRQFLIIQLSEIHPYASAKVLEALEHGHCLVLFDGLDACFSAHTRRHVINAIHSFMIDYAAEDPHTHQTNNFITTSRLADYEPEAFARYAHYTLLDLDDQQIEHFLAKWCSAIESDRVAPGQGTPDQTEREIIETGARHSQHLLSMLKTNGDLNSLAANPLALAIMAFIQANGRNLLLHRFELYKMLTRTLLDTWNQESGRHAFSGAELSLVEDVLGRCGDRLQADDGVLSGYDVESIARQAMAESYHVQAQEIEENDITQLILALRRSSGLFAEVGDDFYCFANQAFQDFYTAVYLLRRSREERRQLAARHFLSIKWSEPLLLILMYKNTRSSRDERREIDEVFQAILNTPGDSSASVPHNLLFVMNSIASGGLLVTDKELIQRIYRSAEHIAQHQSAHTTKEQFNLIAAILYQFNKQAMVDESPTRPMQTASD